MEDDWDIDSHTIQKLQEKYKNQDFPLFMDALPSSLNNNPHLEALNCILYDEHTPDERAMGFKEQGNLCFQDALKGNKKKFHLEQAISCYTQGIQHECPNATLKSLLYSNRAHAYLLLGKYIECIADCRASIQLDPQNIKSYFRGSKASYYLSLLRQSEQFCLDGLKVECENQPLQNLLKLIEEKKHEKLKKSRETQKKKMTQELLLEQYLNNALQSRGITLKKKVLYDVPLSKEKNAWLDSENHLHWCCILLYPEYTMSEAIVDFHENSTFLDHLMIMFPGDTSYAPWDMKREYIYSNLLVFYEGGFTDNSVVLVPNALTLKTTLSTIGLVSGNPIFHIVVKNTESEQMIQKMFCLREISFPDK
ncbi:tetratricopeptide repeat protein 4 homolog [Hylaeus volcanicus]|uniref:tetratricopeptide repeat protein 4 homolog n=1 Tax=Hylaeus volcanicus TaxID=313075 RepID=UPI0023B77C88|nr:tetratricopeptide repeat protein 4 homolog [Hylaeus volcanicus]